MRNIFIAIMASPGTAPFLGPVRLSYAEAEADSDGHAGPNRGILGPIPMTGLAGEFDEPDEVAPDVVFDPLAYLDDLSKEARALMIADLSAKRDEGTLDDNGREALERLEGGA